MSYPWRTAIITGASSGTGRAMALELARTGTRLALMSRRVEALEELATEIQALGAPAPELFTVDIRDTQVLRQAIEEAHRSLGGIDLMASCAGLGKLTLATDPASLPLVEETLMTNTVGTIMALESAKNFMLERGHGHLIAVSAFVAYRGTPGCAAYAASKAALAVYLDGLDLELRLAKTDIRTTTVYPGYVRTPASEGLPTTPMIQEPDVVARRILRAAARKQRVAKFPGPIALVMALIRVLPRSLYSVVARQMLRDLVAAQRAKESLPQG